jgi:hypothetical protein
VRTSFRSQNIAHFEARRLRIAAQGENITTTAASFLSRSNDPYACSDNLVQMACRNAVGDTLLLDKKFIIFAITL